MEIYKFDNHFYGIRCLNKITKNIIFEKYILNNNYKEEIIMELNKLINYENVLFQVYRKYNINLNEYNYFCSNYDDYVNTNITSNYVWLDINEKQLLKIIN
jgi:hypothetical protein